MRDEEVRHRVGALDASLAALESLPDDAARDAAFMALQGLMGLYAEALSRVVTHARESGGAGCLSAISSDELLRHLLILHGLHPDDVEARVAHALDEVRPMLHAHGGDVALLGLEGDVVRLRLQGSCHGCPSSAATLRSSVEEALRRAAPEIARIETEGEVSGGGAPSPPAFIPLASVQAVRR